MSNDYIIVMDKFGGAHLEHKQHKYIKREWKNGRWVYTYPDTVATDFLYDQWKRKSNATKSYNAYKEESSRNSSIQKRKIESKKIYNQGLKDLDDQYNNMSYLEKQMYKKSGIDPKGNLTKEYNESKSKLDAYDKDSYKRAMAARNEYYTNMAKYAREDYKMRKEWEKTPISKLQTAYHKSIDSMSARVEKGKKIIDSLLSKLKKKVNGTAISTAKKLGLKTQQVETRTDISTGQKWKRVNGGPWEKVK